jgi:hypothetical protein
MPIVTEAVKKEAGHWLREYASRVNCSDSPNQAFDRLIDDLQSGELCFHGTDLHSFGELNESGDPKELKRNAELFLGIRIDWGQFSYSCFC